MLLSSALSVMFLVRSKIVKVGRKEDKTGVVVVVEIATAERTEGEGILEVGKRVDIQKTGGFVHVKLQGERGQSKRARRVGTW